jgi:dTDP-4-amino-4,6-dideoxygalactose transaminase
MAVLDRRLRTYDRDRLECRAGKGELLTRLLEPRVVCAGRAATPHNSWVFPILVENPADCIAALRQAGFDATQGHSMCVVPPPKDRPQLEARRAASALAKIVYLPIYPEIPDEAIEAMSRVVLEAAVPPSFPSEYRPEPGPTGAVLSVGQAACLPG